jgi:hypothetical protein
MMAREQRLPIAIIISSSTTTVNSNIKIINFTRHCGIFFFVCFREKFLGNRLDQNPPASPEDNWLVAGRDLSNVLPVGGRARRHPELADGDGDRLSQREPEKKSQEKKNPHF